MRAHEAVRKALAILVAVCCVGVAATAAAGDKKVDCDKTPTNPDCQAKK